jgi:two-component system cell cycle sensor histidine kinase/response regulator CckA
MAKKQILIVDDELFLLYSLRRMLEDLYDVTIASGGKKAIDVINKQSIPFDLIICDVSMPDLNGVNFYLYIAEHHPGLEKRIIFMTGGPLSVYLDDFFVKNKTLCLAKPFEYDQLRQIVKDFLESHST